MDTGIFNDKVCRIVKPSRRCVAATVTVHPLRHVDLRVAVSAIVTHLSFFESSER